MKENLTTMRIGINKEESPLAFKMWTCSEVIVIILPNHGKFLIINKIINQQNYEYVTHVTALLIFLTVMLEPITL